MDGAVDRGLERETGFEPATLCLGSTLVTCSPDYPIRPRRLGQAQGVSALGARIWGAHRPPVLPQLITRQVRILQGICGGNVQVAAAPNP
jgi:hypothetical protein